MSSRLHVSLGTRNGATFMRDCFCTQPFKVIDITENANAGTAQLMLMSSSPGILDTDRYFMNFELDEHSSIELKTQAYQRIFKMNTGASQELIVRMQKGSSFIFLPHPCVPHESSIFSSLNQFYLSNDCVLIWGEVLTCGRKLNGEIFRLSRYHSVSEVFLNGKLIIRENLLVDPSLINPVFLGQLEGYTHQSSLLCMGHFSSDGVVESIHELVSLQEEISFGLSMVPGGIIVRLMGYKAEQLHNILVLIGTLLKNTIAPRQTNPDHQPVSSAM